MSNPSSYRRKENRCTAVKIETGGKNAAKQQKRSWRCDLVEGHSGLHESHSGHRSWAIDEAGKVEKIKRSSTYGKPQT